MVGLKSTETQDHVLLKALGFVICYRDRMEIEKRVPRDDIQLVPDLVQLDFRLEVSFWGECGDCTVEKLNKLAVKVPEAEICVLKKCPAESFELLRKMDKAKLRKNRYKIITFNSDDFVDLKNHLELKNSIYLCSVDLDTGEIQMDFNGLWYEFVVNIQTF